MTTLKEANLRRLSFTVIVELNSFRGPCLPRELERRDLFFSKLHLGLAWRSRSKVYWLQEGVKSLWVLYVEKRGTWPIVPSSVTTLSWGSSRLEYCLGVFNKARKRLLCSFALLVNQLFAISELYSMVRISEYTDLCDSLQASLTQENHHAITKICQTYFIVNLSHSKLSRDTKSLCVELCQAI